MSTPDAPATPDVDLANLEPGAAREDGYYVFNVKRQLWRLPVGALFEDAYHKQIFRKTAEVLTSRGRKRHQLECVASPFKGRTKPLGPVCSAFFCLPGQVVYREGSLQVFVRGERKESHAQEESMAGGQD